MREIRHEETKTRSPGTGIITWLPSRNRRAFERDLPLSIIRCPITLARGLATSHGGQGSYRLSGALSEKGTTSAAGGGFRLSGSQAFIADIKKRIRCRIRFFRGQADF